MSQDIVEFIMINILALQDNHLERPHCHSLLQCCGSRFRWHVRAVGWGSAVRGRGGGGVGTEAEMLPPLVPHPPFRLATSGTWRLDGGRRVFVVIN